MTKDAEATMQTITELATVYAIDVVGALAILIIG